MQVSITFQALGFYKKLGFLVFAELEDMPHAETIFFLMK